MEGPRWFSSREGLLSGLVTNLRLWALAISGVLVLSACEGNVPVGIALTSSEQGIELIVQLCSDNSRVTGVSVSVDDEERKGSREIWAIRSLRPDGGPGSRFTIGKTPEGFIEETRLAGPLPENQYVYYTVGVSNKVPGGFGAFKPSQLEPGKVFVTNRNMSQEEFERIYACRA